MADQLTPAQTAFQQKVKQQVNEPSTQRDVLKATGTGEGSAEKKAGAQRQAKPKIKPRPKVAKVERRASLKAAGKARGHGLSSLPAGDPQRRVDVMRAAGYPEQRISDWMQEEGKRLLQQGWERQNVGRFQPP